MIVRVATGNPVKVRATARAFRRFFRGVRVERVACREGGIPESLAEIVKGARRRANRVFADCDFAVGIEAGTFRYGLVTVACVTDGRRSAIGGSPFFEFRPGLSADETGMIGALTRRRITREEVTTWAVLMALAPFVGR